MLTVQIMSGRVEADLMNGNSHSRYHGYMTGAHKSDAAMGQANASGEHASEPRLSQIAAAKPTRTANPAKTSGAAKRSSTANTGSLNQKLWM